MQVKKNIWRKKIHIFKLCRKKNILVNTVDDLDKCGFIFPAVVHKNDITVGISTSGKSPIFASYLRMKTENMIDEKCLETYVFYNLY